MELSRTIADLAATLLNGEKQLQSRLRSCDHPGLSDWSRQVLAHTLQSSEHVAATLADTMEELESPSGTGHIAYSSEPFIRRIILQPAPSQEANNKNRQADFETAAALLRFTKLRIADLSLLRVAIVALGNTEARQRINQLLEDAYLSAERLREFVAYPTLPDSETPTNEAPPTCRSCRYWAGNSKADEPAKAACLHPELSGVRLQVSARSDCVRHEGTALIAD